MTAERDPTWLSLNRLIEELEKQGIPAKELRPEHLFKEGERWIYSSAAQGPELKENVSLKQVLRAFHQGKNNEWRCLRTALGNLSVE